MENYEDAEQVRPEFELSAASFRYSCTQFQSKYSVVFYLFPNFTSVFSVITTRISAINENSKLGETF